MPEIDSGISELLSMTVMIVIVAPVCFANSAAYPTDFFAAFEPSVGTRIFEIINPPFRLHSIFIPESGDRQINYLIYLSLRAPEGCVAISSKEVRLRSLFRTK
jgi:hypothetical protein